LITPSTVDPDRIVTETARAAKVTDAAPLIGITIGLELGKSVVATWDETASGGDFTTSQHGWITLTVIVKVATGTW
jgi:hypothetical protein